MKKLTKKEIISQIENVFREHPCLEVNVNDMPFRNGRWGFHGYCLCLKFDHVMVKPWSGADTYWLTDLMKQTKENLNTILERALSEK